MGWSGITGAQMIKFNKQQLSKRERFFDKKVQNDSYYGGVKDHTKMSPTALANYKKKLRQNAKHLENKQWIIFFVVMYGIVSGLIYLLFLA